MTSDQGKRFAKEAVAEAIQRDIEAGVFAVGTELPAYRQLAADHGCVTNTAMAAVGILIDRGFVQKLANGRAAVRDRSQRTSEQELFQLRSELDELRAQVRESSVTLTTVDSRLAEIIARLNSVEL
jgi:DNA-binding transcriptional regulator YhcF (GntR family)